MLGLLAAPLDQHPAPPVAEVNTLLLAQTLASPAPRGPIASVVWHLNALQENMGPSKEPLARPTASFVHLAPTIPF